MVMSVFISYKRKMVGSEEIEKKILLPQIYAPVLGENKYVSKLQRLLSFQEEEFLDKDDYNDLKELIKTIVKDLEPYLDKYKEMIEERGMIKPVIEDGILKNVEFSVLSYFLLMKFVEKEFDEYYEELEKMEIEIEYVINENNEIEAHTVYNIKEITIPFLASLLDRIRYLSGILMVFPTIVEINSVVGKSEINQDALLFVFNLFQNIPFQHK